MANFSRLLEHHKVLESSAGRLKSEYLQELSEVTLYTCNHIYACITLPRHMLYGYIISFNNSNTKLKHCQYQRIDTFAHFTKFNARQIFSLYNICVCVCTTVNCTFSFYILYTNAYSLQQYGEKQLRVNLAYRGGRGGRGRGGPGRGGLGRGELTPQAPVCIWQPSGVQ